MTDVRVGSRVPEGWFALAGMSQSLPATTPKSGIYRMALALFQGRDINEARELAHPRMPKSAGLSTTDTGKVDYTCGVPEELAELPEGVSPSYAIRVGMAMAMGYSRDDAERFAQLPHGGGWTKGKPRK
jgi:hypothetical protein